MIPVMGKRARRTAIARVTGRKNVRKGSKDKGNWDKTVFLPRGVSKSFPMPGVYETQFSSSFIGYTTSLTGSGDYSWNFALNNLYHPWNTGYTSGLTPTGVSFSTLAPAFFSTLCSAALYQNFRVLDSQIFVDLIPQSVNDSISCSIVATNNAGPLVTQVMNQRGAKTMDFSSGRTPKSEGLVARTSVSKFLGVSNAAIKNDLSYNYCGTYNSAPSKLIYWLVSAETADNTTLTLPVEVRVRIVWRVELFALLGINAPLTVDLLTHCYDSDDEKHEPAVIVHPPPPVPMGPTGKEMRPPKRGKELMGLGSIAEALKGVNPEN